MNVIIRELEEGHFIETTIPIIPKKDDKIGVFFLGKYYICEIHSLVYEFKENGVFDRVEIGVIMR